MTKSALTWAGVLDEPYSAKPAQRSSHTGPTGYIGWTRFQPIYSYTGGPVLGFPVSSKKIVSRKTKQDGTEHCFVGIPPVSRNKKLTEFRYESYRGGGEWKGGPSRRNWSRGGGVGVSIFAKLVPNKIPLGTLASTATPLKGVSWLKASSKTPATKRFYTRRK